MNNKNIELGWCLIPPQVMGKEDLSDCDKMVYGRILGLLNMKGYCFASNSWLGIQIQKNKHTISTSISNLKNKSLIRVELVRDENKKIIERKIFVPLYTNSAIPMSENGHTPMSENGLDSVESNKVENNIVSKDSANTELKDLYQAREQRKARKSKFGQQLKGSLFSKPFPQFEKKKRVYVDGRGVV